MEEKELTKEARELLVKEIKEKLWCLDWPGRFHQGNKKLDKEKK